MEADTKIAAEAAALTELLGDIWGKATMAARAKADLPALAPTQARTLHLVSEADGVTPAELAAQLNMSRPMVSEVIRKLEANGLVLREKSETDGRSVVVRTTERGRYVQRYFHLGVTDSFAAALRLLPYEDAAKILMAMPALAHLRDLMVTETEV